MSVLPAVSLENEPIWQECSAFAELIYKLLPELPESEKWTMVARLQTVAVDMLYYSAEALGNTSPSASLYDWGSVNKSANAFKSLYRFAGRQHMIELDPQVMVRINNLLKLIKLATDAARQNEKRVEERELDIWRKKQTIWKEISHEN